MNFKLKYLNRSIYRFFFFVIIASGFIFTVSFSLKNTKQKQDKVAKGSANAIPEVKDGDIIFQSSKSQQSKAVELATNSVFSHCGIIFIENGVPYVYEAVQPVGKRPLIDWIKSGVGKKYKIRRLIDRGILMRESLESMRDYALKQVGKNYDIYFSWSDKEMYCSEYVWKIYHEIAKITLVKPKELREFNIDAPLIRKTMFERYGNDIPYNELMVSPGQLYDSNLLMDVN
ncbi:MAG: YiiX family permuted papain-like enzyme [Crocinitomicaceae bacterium]|nr:YiiX family permuted papain-like enzyme [Crocinitomicaceae bacterium]